MNIAVVGTGYVGLTTGACFASQDHKVSCYDILPEKVESLRRGEVPIYEPGLEELVKMESAKGRLSFTNDLAESIKDAEVVFVSVPTPTGADGSANLTYLESSVKQIAQVMDGYKVVVEKSTSPVQTAQGLKRVMADAAKGKQYDIVVNPEFLREGSAIQDFLHPDRIVVGVETDRARDVMGRLYEPFKKRNVPIHWTDLNTAELIKHASNALLAVKISYANLLARLCAKTGANVQQVADGTGADKRIGRAFLDAGLGYGGSCFPKDLAALRYVLRQHGVPDDMLKAVSDINDGQVGHFVDMANDAVGGLEGKMLGIWGLAFKPNTDDIREARSIPIVRELAKRGAVLRAYDPKAMRTARAVLEDPALAEAERVKLAYCSDAFDAVKGADAVLLLTEWDEFKQADLKRLRALTPCVVDGRNVYDPTTMRRLGFTYRSVGRP